MAAPKCAVVVLVALLLFPFASGALFAQDGDGGFGGGGDGFFGGEGVDVGDVAVGEGGGGDGFFGGDGIDVGEGSGGGWSDFYQGDPASTDFDTEDIDFGNLDPFTRGDDGAPDLANTDTDPRAELEEFPNRDVVGSPSLEAPGEAVDPFQQAGPESGQTAEAPARYTDEQRADHARRIQEAVESGRGVISPDAGSVGACAHGTLRTLEASDPEIASRVQELRQTMKPGEFQTALETNRLWEKIGYEKTTITDSRDVQPGDIVVRTRGATAFERWNGEPQDRAHAAVALPNGDLYSGKAGGRSDFYDVNDHDTKSSRVGGPIFGSPLKDFAVYRRVR